MSGARNIVCQAGPAPLIRAPLRMSQYDPSKFYTMWCRNVEVKSLALASVIYDCPGQWLGRHYESANVSQVS